MWAFCLHTLSACSSWMLWTLVPSNLQNYIMSHCSILWLNQKQSPIDMSCRWWLGAQSHTFCAHLIFHPQLSLSTDSIWPQEGCAPFHPLWSCRKTVRDSCAHEKSSRTMSPGQSELMSQPSVLQKDNSGRLLYTSQEVSMESATPFPAHSSNPHNSLFYSSFSFPSASSDSLTPK